MFKQKFQAGRRVIVFGDLHGDWANMVGILKMLDYDPDEDLVIAVGDLIDRGPESHKVFNWFFEHENRMSIMGNHEDMMLHAMENPAAIRSWMYNGGFWAHDLPNEVMADLYAKADSLPLAIELELDTGEQVGFVHAQVPTAFKTWSEFKQMATVYAGARQRAMWDRDYAKSGTAPLIPDIDLVICGHSVLPQHKLIGNHLFIDTGSVFAEETNNYKLTAAVIDPNTPLSNIRIVSCRQ